jgi:hypothetical protein
MNSKSPSQLVADLVTQSLSSFDAVAEAERIIGAEAVGTDRGSLVALALQVENSRLLADNLMQRQDSTHSTGFQEFLEIALDLGFETVQITNFTHSTFDNKLSEERQVIMANPLYGAVLNCASWHKGVNQADLWYAWRPRPYRNTAHILHSGSWESASFPDWRSHTDDDRPEDAFWFGHHDVRQGFKFGFERMIDAGTFLNPWPAGAHLEVSSVLQCYNDYVEFRDKVVDYGVRRASLNSKVLNRYIDCTQLLKDIVNRPIV